MRVRYRNGEEKNEKNFQEKILSIMYNTRIGRSVLKVLIRPGFSKLGGLILSSKASSVFVTPFRKINNISLKGCEKTKFSSFNDFFTRKLKDGERVFPEDDNIIGSPCDSKVTHLKIQDNLEMKIKGATYNVSSLLRDEKLAKRYKGGDVLILRLSVDDYHRYAFPFDGEMSQIRKIDGVFHTVDPVATEKYPIYKENTRTYQLVKTKKCGIVLFMEVGALLVGKIVNNKGKGKAHIGEEKGHFAFGGSTVVLMFEKGRVLISNDIVENSKDGFETYVSMGDEIADINI